MTKKIFLNFLSLLFLLAASCSEKRNTTELSIENNLISFENGSIKLVFDQQMKYKIYRKSGDQLLSVVSTENTPDYLIINESTVKDFTVDDKKVDLSDVDNNYGKGKKLLISGTANGPSGSLIEKTLSIELYEEFPQAALVSVEYRNVYSTSGLVIKKEINNSFKLDASLTNNTNNKHDFWILQGGSYDTRPDWILPVSDSFSFENYQGQNWENSEAGGGLPVLDVWTKETGFFIGSIRNKPTLISLPARVNDEGYLEISIEYKRENIKFEDIHHTIPTVIGVHDGDFYNGLTTYAHIMEHNGFEMMKPNLSDPVYDAIFCGWGFGPDFTTKQMLDVIPQLEEFNLNVVTVDMGWFYINGDYEPRDNAFPNGASDMKEFTQAYHDNGIKVKLWITPSIAGPELMKKHPEWLLRDKNGNPVTHKIYLTEDSAAYLCPAVKGVQEYHRQLIKTMIDDWGFDGFKIDQSLVNSIGRCYAKDHNHEYPEESVEALPEIYKIITETALNIKPYTILEVCPCGMFPDFYKMPYYNQPIASDPNTPWQVRHRSKIIKALMGPRAAFLGDMVERRVYKASNFATMIGVGGIPETMFTPTEEDNFYILRKKFPGYLDPQREKDFKKWFDIYRKYELSKGKYLNLYDLAYDKPEAHVIHKDNILHFAFYAEEWDGEIEFRGLDNREYIIQDYVKNREIGKITGNSKLHVHFSEYLLVQAIPVKEK